MADYYPKTKSEGDEINKILEKMQDDWFDYDVARSRLVQGTAKGNEASEYARLRKKLEKDLRRVMTLFKF